MSVKTLNYNASPEIQSVIASLGRTEDIKFSADGKYLGLTEFLTHKIYIFEISRANGADAEIELLNCVSIVSEDIELPHGFEFLGSQHFIVANRAAGVTIFKIPVGFSGAEEVKLAPAKFVFGKSFFGRVCAPGSVGVYQTNENSYRVLVCNNYLNTIVGFDITIKQGLVKVRNKGVIIKKALNLPDGISISDSKKWVAVSNHNTGSVLIYPLSSLLNRFTSPVATLTGIAYPHGLRFTHDDKNIFVADAGSQYIHVFESNGGNWQGDYEPTRSLKMVSKDDFLKQPTAEEGGIKGLDISQDDKVLVATAQYQVLKFYSVKALMETETSEEDHASIQQQLEYYKTLERDVELEPGTFA
jgi:hypothetical protein